MHYLIQKSHRFLAIVSPNKHCNVSICDYFYIISIAGRKCFRVSYGYGKDFPPMHGLKLVPFALTASHLSTAALPDRFNRAIEIH